MSLKKPEAIVLVSGGMDSALTAAIAEKKYNLNFLHVNYGQKTEMRELKAFNEISVYYKVTNKLIADISYLGKIGGSSLTDYKLKIAKADLKSKNIPTSYVPFRNANILSIAVSWAEIINAGKIFIGAVEEDSSGYPDCRKDFFKSFNDMIRKGSKAGSGIKIVTPIINMSKKEIVLKSVKIGSPLHLTWSCYKNNAIACGECDSCALRLRGFQSAGVKDPVIYKKIISYN
ncbi:MAG TPA: 7-cyano-7-deazaguanine synthase QueC [Ignavibacteria bacterium]|nr:7-cyano-7-deazaguanine synthase QueC [Bacteroidota bacterium]HRI86093.1 7-cyano-7-deazaguanine synthase QueC [Ignavibacteria bacterium]HRJ98070.1 7-cyano-7-deazaguanine synthase QueC [Ignavibacteria bacterium]